MVSGELLGRATKCAICSADGLVPAHDCESDFRIEIHEYNQWSRRNAEPVLLLDRPVDQWFFGQFSMTFFPAERKSFSSIYLILFFLFLRSGPVHTPTPAGGGGGRVGLGVSARRLFCHRPAASCCSR
jgi:hypothetical protein